MPEITPQMWEDIATIGLMLLVAMLLVWLLTWWKHSRRYKKLNGEYQDLNGKFGVLQGDKDKIQSAYDSAERSRLSLDEQLTSTRGQLESANSELSLLKVDSGDLQTKYDALHSQHADTKALLLKMRQEMGVLQSGYESIDADLAAKDAVISEKDTTINRLLEIEKQYGTLLGTQGSWDDEKRELKLKLDEVAKQRDLYAKDLEEAKAFGNALSEENDKQTAELEQLLAVRMEYQKMRPKFEEYKSAIVEANALKGNSESMVSELEDMKIKQHNLVVKSKSDAQKIAQLKEQLVSKEIELQQEAGKHGDLANMEQEVVRMNKRVENIEAHNTELSLKLEESQKESKKQLAQIDSLEMDWTKFKELKNDKEYLKQKVTNLEKHNHELTLSLSSGKDVDPALLAASAPTDAPAPVVTDEAKAEIELMNTKLSALEEAKKAYKARVDELEKEQKKFKSEISGLKKDVAEASKAATTGGEDAEGYKSALAEARKQLEESRARIQKLQADLDAQAKKQAEAVKKAEEAAAKAVEAAKPKPPAPKKTNANSSNSKQADKSAVLDKIRAKAANLDFSSIGKADESERDNLKEIKGIGPFIEEKLNALGIYTFRQISNLSPKDEDNITDAIEFFPGRIRRDRWVAQASRLLKRKKK